MRKNILLLLFLLLSFLCFSQDRELDSLQVLLEKSKEDTLKVDLLLSIAKVYSATSPESSTHFSQLAMTLAEKLNYKKGQALAYKMIGIVYYNKGIYAEAINNWQKAAEIFDTIHYKVGSVNILSNIGAAYFNGGDDTKSNEYNFRALIVAEEISDTLRMSTVLNNIAATYQRKDQAKAKEFYLRSLPLGEKIEDDVQRHSLVGATLSGLGEVYLKSKETDSNIVKHNLDTAIYYTERAIKEYKGTVDEPYALNQLGEILAKMKQYDKAIDIQKKAFEIASKFESTNDIAIALVGMAQSYQNKGDNKLAIKTFSEAEKVAKETDASYVLRDIYKGLSDLYKKSHDYINAFNYQYLLTGINDTIYNVTKEKELQGIQFRFDLEKKEGEINLLTKDNLLKQKESERQKFVKNIFVGGFAIVLLFAGIFFNQRNRIAKEKKRSDELLLNILPEETAEELKATGTAKAKSFELVSVLFTDFKNFTQASELLTPEELVEEINHCYSEFDKIITKYGIEKIKTIGDSYMCAGGLPVSNKTHAVDVIKAGLEMQQFIAKNKEERVAKGQPFFDLRLGIHTGPVVAGIVGIKKFAYDIWGDTVNTASRMESSGQIGKVNISGATYEIVKDKFICTARGKIEAKNKGFIEMYFVESSL